MLFDKVQFIVPGNEIITDVSGDRSGDIRFKDCTPQKPASWQTTAWGK